jgi:hypothetical protein
MSALGPPPFLESLREEFARVAEADAQAAAAAPARRRRPRLRLPQMRLAVPATVMVLALLAGVGVIASGVLSPTADKQGQIALQNGDGYGASLLRTLSVLQQLPEPADALPPGLDERGLATAAIKLDPPPPAAAAGAPYTQGAWVVPALDDPDRLLLVVATATGLGGSPGLTARDVATGRAYLYTEEGGGRALIGLVPDGVETVTAHLARGGTVELPVRDNTFGAVLPTDGGIARISWDGMTGP